MIQDQSVIIRYQLVIIPGSITDQPVSSQKSVRDRSYTSHALLRFETCNICIIALQYLCSIQSVALLVQTFAVPHFFWSEIDDICNSSHGIV